MALFLELKEQKERQDVSNTLFEVQHRQALKEPLLCIFSPIGSFQDMGRSPPARHYPLLLSNRIGKTA